MSPLKKSNYHGTDGNESLEVAELFQEECLPTSPEPTGSVLSVSYSSRASNRTSFLGDQFLPVDMLPEEACLSPSSCSMSVDCEASQAADELAEREIFDKARHYLNPGPMLRYAIYLFSERKMLTFFLVHMICTLVVFGHFFLIKFDQKAEAVPEFAPRYWWKRIVPPLEFGTMHAILFQMALIPLTMSRYSIANLSDSAIHKFIPLNRAIRMHIHLGYTICILLVLTTIFFFIFFGLLCSDGDQSICAKFTSQIMCTGYGIIASILILLGTSFFRHRIPYEVFYSIHHIVFIFYALTIAHTLDDKQRNHEEQRSQTFKWFSATLVYYLCDRMAMYFTQKHTVRLVSSSTIEGSSGTRMIILRLRRPVIFNFKPGQYAFLRLKDIDHQWHPFSIASGPASSYLEFYIEVCKKDSWTDKLWYVLEGDGDGQFSNKQIDFDVLGPCGTSLAKTEDYSHALAVGTGTGIVPILSLYKQHVRQLLRLDPWSHFADLEDHRKKIVKAEKAMAPRRGSIAKKLASSCAPLCMRDTNVLDTATHAALGPNDSLAFSIREKIQRHERLMRWKDVYGNSRDMKANAFKATRSIYGICLMTLLPAIGTLLIGLTISWNTTSANLRPWMPLSLQGLTGAFYLVFAFISIGIWDCNHLGAYTDAAVCLVAPFASWYFFLVYRDNGTLSPGDITTSCLLMGYMTARLWACTVKPHHKSWRKSVDTDGIGALDRLELVWVSRSASLVSEIWPDINIIWDVLAEQWGVENAAKVCKISVYVTDKDATACELLSRELASSQLFRDGAIKFGRRPDFATLIEDHTIEMICSRKKSNTLLAFCGSQEVAEEIHHHKVSTDMITALTGNEANHQMDFVSESYGGARKSKQAATKERQTQSLTTRTVISYNPSASRKFLV